MRVRRDISSIPFRSATETWLRIMQAHDRILRRIDAAIRRHHGISLTAYDALRRIAEGEPAGQAAEAAGLTRPVQPATVNRLVADGLLVRGPGDDEGWRHARLTPAGRERLAAATATHDDLLGHLLTLLGDDAAVVTDALARVSRAARPRT